MRPVWPEVVLLLAAASSAVAQGRAADAPSTRRLFLTGQRLLARAPLTSPTGRAPSPTGVGVGAYRRFHANDSLVGKSVPCTRDEKTCFHYNLLFDPKTDMCQPIWKHCDLAPNRQAFENESGRIFGICREYADPCPGYRMAYDGRCYRKEMVRDVICGCDAKPTRHFLGGVECRCSPARSIAVQQPRNERQCRIPDLRFPDIVRRSFYRNGLGRINYTMACTAQQSACFSKKKVWVREGSGCFALLERGPCPKGYVVVLDLEAVKARRAEARCSHLRGGCPTGQTRVAFDGRCHSDRFLKIAAPGKVVHNHLGQNTIIPVGMMYFYTPASYGRNICSINLGAVGSALPDLQYPKPQCSENNKKLCSLYKVESQPPMPD